MIRFDELLIPTCHCRQIIKLVAMPTSACDESALLREAKRPSSSSTTDFRTLLDPGIIKALCLRLGHCLFLGNRNNLCW